MMEYFWIIWPYLTYGYVYFGGFMLGAIFMHACHTEEDPTIRYAIEVIVWGTLFSLVWPISLPYFVHKANEKDAPLTPPNKPI